MEGRLLQPRPIVRHPAGVHSRRAARRFAFAPGLVLAVSGDRATLDHFAAEYGAVSLDIVSDAHVAVEVEIEVVPRLSGNAHARETPPGWSGGIELHDGHRTTRWTARIGPPDEPTLRARIAASGLFGRSFVQGFVVEPLLSVAAARSGRMLLPGAGLLLDGGLVLVLGRSHVGKTTLAAQALAAGHAILGDDQVLLGGDGLVSAFPRRMRVYSDIGTTAPAAQRALPAGTRLELALRAAAERVVGRRLSLPVLAGVPAASAPPARAARILLIERASARTPPGEPLEGGQLRAIPVEPAEMERTVLALAEEQRERLAAAATEGWDQALRGVSALERDLVHSGLADVPAERVVIPSRWEVGRSAAALAAIVGLPR